MGQFLVVTAYTLSLAFLFIYSLGQLHLTLNYLRFRKRKTPRPPQLTYYPMVTVQLPLYNEKYVAERLLTAIAQLDYPHHLLEIQVLDDSTDETVSIVADVLKTFPDSLRVKHIRRPHREGFKAGALKYGTEIAEGEFLAIFDADFLPKPDFLFSTLPYFGSAEVGVVQTRWEHINKEYSRLTHFQAFGLDAHFTVEQSGRYFSNCFISFNGTAGIWRKTCVTDAGGWQSDTLTEDLDLSYRAQLKGWKFLFLEDIGAPAELPITLNAFKSQQYRWNKGAAETHRKVWRKVWQTPLPLSIKFHAILQLFKGMGFVSSMVLALTSVPIIVIRNQSDQYNVVLHILSITLLCIVILGLFYYASLTRFIPSTSKRLKYFLVHFPPFIAFSFGVTLHNSLAVIEGYLGRKTPFVRTPKFNITEPGSALKSNIYNLKKIAPLTWIEGGLIFYFLYGVWLAIQHNDYSFLPFHLLIALGYFMVFVYSFSHHWKLKRAIG